MPRLVGSFCGRGAVMAAALAVAAQATTMAAGITVDPASPFGRSGDWERIFTEEFDGPGLNADIWTRCYWWDDNGCTNLATGELQWYLPANVEMAEGVLRLTARAEKAVGHEGRIFPYTSGIVTTGRDYEERSTRHDRFAARFGYFEVRARPPQGKGLWSALWMLPSTQESKPEIDIMEVLGHRPDVLEMHFHYRTGDEDAESVGAEADVADLSQDWHVYAVDWRPDSIVWYLDGVEQWRYDGPGIPDEPMYLLMNLAVGGEWAGSPGQATKLPAHFLVDYVRIWRRAGS